MSATYPYSAKRPRTIDRLDISDCTEIILNDLARYGVPHDLCIDLLKDYFIPLKRKSDILKQEYGEIWFKNTPDSSFENN